MMNLRCRKGDLAIVTRGVYLGYIVEVLEFIGESSGINPDGINKTLNDAWVIKANFPLKGVHETQAFIRNIASDKHLLPIRPGDLQEKDEDIKELCHEK